MCLGSREANVFKVYYLSHPSSPAISGGQRAFEMIGRPGDLVPVDGSQGVHTFFGARKMYCAPRWVRLCRVQR